MFLFLSPVRTRPNTASQALLPTDLPGHTEVFFGPCAPVLREDFVFVKKMEYALSLDVAVLLKGGRHRGPVTPAAPLIPSPI